MNTALDPLISEFHTDDDAVSHDAWLRSKVQTAMNSTKPRIPHDQVMAEMRAMLDAKIDRIQGDARRVE